jgi:nicotinate-nucleotide adenylyltransferase
VIGILGGTFDPVHIGHLRLAIEAREVLSLSEVRFIPARQSPLRAPPQADAELRLALLQAALQDEPGCVLDTRELARPGPSYTVDTLRELRAAQADTPLCLLLGMDAFNGLAGWRDWRSLTDYAHLAVFARPGCAVPESGPVAEWSRSRLSLEAADLHARPCGRVWIGPLPPLAVSATALRASAAAGRSLRHLTPSGVCRLLEREQPYRKP